MTIPCYRCGRGLDRPNDKNADYVMAPDTAVAELRTFLRVLQHTAATLEKRVRGEEIKEEEYLMIEVERAEEVAFIPDIASIKPFEKSVKVQKTGIVCPECWDPADFVIWGVHKNEVLDVH